MSSLILPVGLLLILFILSGILTRSISGFLYQRTKSKNFTVILFSLLFLPGTLIHELAHYMAATLLFVPVGKMTLIPKMDEDNLKLGSVAIAKTDPFRRMLIGVAPFLVGTTILILIYYFNASIITNITRSPLKALIIGFVIFQIGNTMFSSKKDLEGTLELLLTIAVFATAAYLVGIRVPIAFLESLFSNQTKGFLQNVNIFLGIPVLMDLLLILLIKTLRR